jgi:16S rRNA (uracil1498-N3)-methyltransferase
VSSPLFFVETLADPVARLSPEDTRHALRSLRLRRGDPVALADGRGGVGVGRLEGEREGRASVAVEESRRVIRRAPVVSVALAPPTGERLTWAVQKLAELGVDEVLCIETERSVRTWRGDRVDRAVTRLRSVAREAAMQSRQPFVMEVDGDRTLEDLLRPAPPLVIMLWEEADLPLAHALPDEVPSVRVVVGPEGGFSAGEAGRARDAGAVTVSLGPGILRTETAAVVGAALVLSRYGRLG